MQGADLLGTQQVQAVAAVTHLQLNVPVKPDTTLLLLFSTCPRTWSISTMPAFFSTTDTLEPSL